MVNLLLIHFFNSFRDKIPMPRGTPETPKKVDKLTFSLFRKNLSSFYEDRA